MTNKERELIMKNMSGEQRECYREFIADVGPRLKLSDGRRVSLKALIESGRVSVPAEIRRAIEAVSERDAMGPVVGAPAIDFHLKRLDEDNFVQLLDFKNRRPVALIFGSYT